MVKITTQTGRTFKIRNAISTFNRPERICIFDSNNSLGHAVMADLTLEEATAIRDALNEVIETAPQTNPVNLND